MCEKKTAATSISKNNVPNYRCFGYIAIFEHIDTSTKHMKNANIHRLGRTKFSIFLSYISQIVIEKITSIYRQRRNIQT